MFGGRDHSTVINGLKVMSNLIKYNEDCPEVEHYEHIAAMFPRKSSVRLSPHAVPI
jgi:hypothetical protein